MPSSSVRTFTDPAEFGAAIRAGKIEVTTTGRGVFSGKITRIDLHQRTSEAVSIGVVGIPGPMLEHYASGLIGRSLALLSEASIVNLQTSQKQQLLRLHARIGRLVETRPNTICHPEASRAIEQELIEALVTCLVNGDARRASPHGHTIGRTLAALESLLAEGSDRSPSTTEMSTALGISEQSLRSYCAASFDMSPNRYARLRRAERRKKSGQQ